MPAAYHSSDYGQAQTYTTHGGIYYLIPASTVYNNGAYFLEEQGQVLVKSAGSYGSLGIRITANTTTTSVFSIKSFKNSVQGNIDLTVPSGATGFFQDLGHSDSVAVDDLYTFRYTATFEWFATVTWTTVQFIFTADDPDETVSRIMTEEQGAYPYINAADDYYAGIFSQLVYNAGNFPTVDTVTRACIPYDCTVRNAYTRVPTNSADASVVLTLQKDSVDTAITITIPAGTTGTFEDATHTVSFLTDDKIGWKLATSLTSGTCYITHICEELVSLEDKWVIGLGQQTRTFTGAGTTYFNIGGVNNNIALTALQNSNQSPLNGSCLGLCINVTANTTGGNSYLSWYTNEVQGNNIVTIPSGLTGFFDIADTDDFVVGDQLNIALEVPSGTLQASNITWVGNVPSVLTDGTIIVVKETNPPGSSQEFEFNATNLTPSSFTLTDGENQTYNGVTPGPGYGISEETITGWTTTYEVSNGNDPGSITVGSGEIIIVTVTNTLAPATGSGLYKIVPQKRQDTLWIDTQQGTERDVKIPDPGIGSAFLGST